MTATIAASQGTSVRIDRIVLGNRKGRDVGDVTSLAASIAAGGLRHPLVLGPTRRLVSGARRLRACTVLGWTEIDAVTVTGIWEAIELMEAEQADAHHVELTVAEAMGLDTALRELAWWPKKPPAPRGANPATPDTGRRERIAHLLGLNGPSYTNARRLWQATCGYKETQGTRHPLPPETQARAAEVFATIRSRRDIRSAYERYCDGTGPVLRKPAPPAPPPVLSRPSTPSGRRPPQRVPAAQIQAGLASMTGTTAALLNACPSGTAVAETQTEAFSTEITNLIRNLSTLRRRLEKGTH